MSQTTHRVTPSIARGTRIPPLENGDHLSREEFERRYEATPRLKKAELIEGVVYMAPPVSQGGHSRPHADLMTVFGTYRAATPGVDIGDNGTLRLDSSNEPQPDAYLLIVPSCGGQTALDADEYVVGAPELVAEIAASSVSFDLHEKLQVYRHHGVREYIVWRTRDREFDYFVLRQGEFQRLAPAADGMFQSEVFPGLWLNTAALLKKDVALALESLKQGINSPEHDTFIAALRQRAGQTGSAEPT
jgi:Uma2 family endonuclease